MARQDSLQHHPLSLRIGDTILLYYNAEKRTSDTEGAQKSGYVIANFSCSSHNSIVLHPAANSDDSQLPNIHSATFRVLAANKHEAQMRYHSELFKQKRKATLAAEAGGPGKINPSSPQLAQAKRDLELELKENKAKQERRNGKAIYYGESVQLQHTMTKKYLAVSSSDTSMTENTKLKVYLEQEDGRGCIFKILPRYKVQSVGEEVHFSDQVKLESVATEGQFLHCSNKTFGEVHININKDCYEMNLAATDSPLTIIKHYQPSPRALSGSNYQTLRGGGIVRFFHRTHECYIVAEGSFAGRFASREKISELANRNRGEREQLSSSISQTEYSGEAAYQDTPLDEPPVSHHMLGSHTQQVEVEVHESSDQGDSELKYAPSSIRSHQLNKAESVTSSSPESSLKVSDQVAISDQAATVQSSPSRDTDLTDIVTNNVHFRKRYSNHGVLKNPSTSANTFWQIEKCSDSRSGEPMIWDETCRIKHLPTRMYLAVKRTKESGQSSNFDQYQSTLVSMNSSDYKQLTEFKLFPVIHQKGGQIHYDSYARIKHVHTDTWLHLNKDQIYCYKQPLSGSEFPDYEESSIDSAKFFMLLATPELNHDDAFTLELVDEDLVANFNHVAGITSVITNQLKEHVCNNEFTQKIITKAIGFWSASPLLGSNRANMKILNAIQDEGTCIRDRSPPHHMPSKCGMKQALMVLSELETFLSNSRERKNRQKLLRNLKVLEVIMCVLELHQDMKESDDIVMSDPEVCRVCFGVIIKYLEGNSSKNKNYITELVQVGFLFTESIWQTPLGEGISVEDVLVALAKDNPALLLPVIGEEKEGGFVQSVGEHLVDKLVSLRGNCHSQRAQLLRGLSVLCECQGAPIQQNQSKILQYLQRAFQRDKDVFSHPKSFRSHWLQPQVAIEIDDHAEIQASPLHSSLDGSKAISKSGDQLTSGEKIKFVNGRDRNKELAHMEFQKAQLQLFIALCKGNNDKAIKALQAEPVKTDPYNSFGIQVSFQDIMDGLNQKNTIVDAGIKAIYVELLQVLYVDVEDNRPFLDQLPYSFVLKDMKKEPFESTTGEEGKDVALTKETNINFPDMKEWISEFFKTELLPLVADQQDKNLLIAQVFRLLALLVSFGYYDDDNDVEELLPKITKCLDGTKDHLTGSKLKSEKRISKYLQRFSRRQTDEDRRIKDLDESKFRMKDRFMNKPKFQALFFVKKYAMEVLDLLFNFRFYKRLHRFVWDFKLHSSSLSSADTKDVKCLKQDPMASKKILEIVTEANSDCAELVETARNRIQEIFKQADGCLENLIKQDELALILFDLAMYENDDLVQGSFQLLDKIFSSELQLFQRAVQAQLLLTVESGSLYEYISERLYKLRQYLSPKICQSTPEQPMESMTGGRKDPESLLKELTEKCWLVGEAIGFEPHQQNQKIIYNFGILSDVLTFMQAEIPSSKNHEKLKECFHFLQALACQNAPVQKRLLHYTSLFMKASRFIGSPVGALLREIFSGGPTITLKIKEEQIIQMMQFLFSQDESSGLGGKLSMILALQELIKVQELDLPLRFNQAIVMKHFSRMREDRRYFCRELLAEGKKDERLELLTSVPDESTRLQLLLMMTDLLASCAEGENSGTESVCRTVYSLEELLEILSHDGIPLYRKRPFTRFLVWVYMNPAGREKTTENARNITQNEKLWKQLWEYLRNVAVLMDAAAQCMLDMPSDDNKQYLTTKSFLRSAQWKFAHKSENPKDLDNVPKVVVRDAQYQAHLPDILLYFGEALLQFVVAFYTNVYESHCKASEEESISKKLFIALLKMCKPLSGSRVYFGMEVQVKLYRRAVHVLKKALQVATRPCGGQHLYDFNSEIQGSVSKMLVTDARKRYDELYGEEVELNKKFNEFVWNYQLAYQGPNTLKGQIDANVKDANKTEYSDFLDKEMRRPGCECLPLGKRFQDHVKYFTKPKYSMTMSPLKAEIGTAVTVNPVTKRLIKQLEISLSRLGQERSEAKRERQVQVDIKSLQILRAIIHNQIVQIDPELKERDPDTYGRQCKARVYPVQNIMIKDYGNAISRLMPLLSHPNEEIVYKVLALLKALLECGNKTVRDHGLASLISAKEHTLFPTLQRMLKQSAVAYGESQFLIARMKDQIITDRHLGLSWELPADKEFLKAKRGVESLEEVGVKSTHEQVELVEFRQRAVGAQSSSLREVVADTNGDATEYTTRPEQSSVQQRSNWSLTLHFPFHIRSRSQGSFMETKQEGKRVQFLAVYDRSDVAEEIGPHAASIVQFQNLKHIELAMEVLGLMCDGQYREMQNYLHEQKESIASVNMVGEVATFLQKIFQSRNITPETIEALHQILQTLIEMCVGNYANQEVIFNKQIMTIINHVLQLDITNITVHSDEHLSGVMDRSDSASKKRALELRKKALDLKGSAVELLEVILEETSSKTKSLALQVAGGLDISAVQGCLIDFDHLAYQDDELKKEEYDDNAERALYRSYHILKRLEDFGVDSKNLRPHNDDDDDPVSKIWGKCEEESNSVEVVYKNAINEEEILTKVHFQFSSKRKFKEVVTSRVKWNIDRSSQDDKLRDFLHWMKALKKNAIHQESLQKYKLLKILLKGGRYRYLFLLLLTLLLNVFAMVGLSIPTVSSIQNMTRSSDFIGIIDLDTDVFIWYYITLYVLGSVHLLVSAWMVTEYFMLNWNNFVLPSFISKIVTKIKRKFALKESQKSKSAKSYSDINLFGLRTIYIVIFLCCSVLSLFSYGLLYSVCLLYIVVNNDILQRALQSVTKNGKSLLSIAVLMLVILLIYSIISFVFLHESVHNKGSSMFCESLGQCFITVLRVGLIDNLGLAIQLNPNNYETAGVRVIFDVSFFIIVTTIALSIVFGIIVDTFSELRDEKFNAENDMKSVCFICGIESHEFDNTSDSETDRGFKRHVKSEHNMWMYMYYSIYLDQIDTSNHNAIEKYIYDKMNDSHIDYFPIKRAISLKDKRDEEKMKVDELKMLVKSINDRLTPLEELVKRDNTAATSN